MKMHLLHLLPTDARLCWIALRTLHRNAVADALRELEKRGAKIRSYTHHDLPGALIILPDLSGQVGVINMLQGTETLPKALLPAIDREKFRMSGKEDDYVTEWVTKMYPRYSGSIEEVLRRFETTRAGEKRKAEFLERGQVEMCRKRRKITHHPELYISKNEIAQPPNRGKKRKAREMESPQANILHKRPKTSTDPEDLLDCNDYLLKVCPAFEIIGVSLRFERVESHIYYSCRFAFNDDITDNLRAHMNVPNLPVDFTFGSYIGQVAIKEIWDVMYIAIYPRHLQDWKEKILDQHIDFLSDRNLLFKNEREKEDDQMLRLAENTSPKNIGNKDLPSLRPPQRYDPIDSASVSEELKARMRYTRMVEENGGSVMPGGPFL